MPWKESERQTSLVDFKSKWKKSENFTQMAFLCSFHLAGGGGVSMHMCSDPKHPLEGGLQRDQVTGPRTGPEQAPQACHCVQGTGHAQYLQGRRGRGLSHNPSQQSRPSWMGT